MSRVLPNVLVVFVALCALSATALMPVSARADQYIVDHCTHPDASPATVFAAISGVSTSTCGTTGGALRFQQPPTPDGTIVMATNEQHHIVLSVPADRPNIQIDRIVTHYSVPAVSTAAGAGFVFVQLHAGSTLIAEHQAGSAGSTAPTIDMEVVPGTRSLDWGLVCDASTCFFGDGFILNVFSTRLYLNESVAPTLTVTGGTLTGAGAKRGQMTLGFDAHDADSGVSSLSVALDSTVIGSVRFACASNDWSACPRDQLAQLLAVDTTQVPNGTHELVVTVRDAANNALSRSLGTVSVANAPGAASVPNGASASRLAKLTARFAATSKRSQRVRFTATPSVTGRLVTEAGDSISGATVAILAKLHQAGAQPVQIATATTGADGAFSHTLPSGPSRTITFAYTAFSGDAKPAATATLTSTVKASVSARISLRTVRAGHPVTLTGKLRLLPRKGIEIKIQARRGNRWRFVDAVTTARDGTFRWRYRFGRFNAGRTFSFRAHVQSPLYPFATTNSRTIRVHVR